VSAELVEPVNAATANDDDDDAADVEVGHNKLVVAVEAKPFWALAEEERPLRLVDLWKNRTVRIIVVVSILLIVGLLVGLILGLQSATRSIENEIEINGTTDDGASSDEDASSDDD
jgi:hypothetical protein